MYDDAKVKTAIAGVEKLANGPAIVSVENHFAGYFNELGFSIFFSESATDSEIISVRNELLAYLGTLLPKDSGPFLWQVGFRRKGKTIEVLFPGDEPRNLSDHLVPL
jgi:hypothetical protein